MKSFRDLKKTKKIAQQWNTIKLQLLPFPLQFFFFLLQFFFSGSGRRENECWSGSTALVNIQYVTGNFQLLRNCIFCRGLRRDGPYRGRHSEQLGRGCAAVCRGSCARRRKRGCHRLFNRWGFNAVQAFEYCIILKTCFHCDGSVTFWFGSKFSISFWFGSKNCVPVHYWNWRVTQNIKFKIKLFLLKHLFQEVPVPVWYLLTSANCKIAVSGTFYVELLKSFWSDAGSGPEDKS